MTFFTNLKQKLSAAALFIAVSVSSQSLTVTSVAPQNPCSGSQITIAFTATSGIFSVYSNSTVFTATLVQNGNIFTGQAIGNFSVSGYNFGGIFSTNSNITKTLTLPAGVTGSNFKIYLSSSNPSSYLGATPSAAFAIGTAPVGGNLQNQTLCPGSVPNALTLSGHSGAVAKWQKSTTANFSSAINIANTSTTLPGSAIGPVTEPVYVRAVVQSGSCQAYSAVALISFYNATTWVGGSSSQWHESANWSCGDPGIGVAVTIPAGSNVVINADASAAGISIGAGATVTVLTGADLTVKNAVVVAESAQLIFQNNANLIQMTDAVNIGKITVNRHSSALKRQDYTLWSAPVQGQNLQTFSPHTVVTPTSRFYTYNTATNSYNSIASPNTTDFSTAKGYLIRMPNNHPATATVWNGKFIGTPNNGTIVYPLANAGVGKRFNLIGNPYPSPVNLRTFISQNSANITGTLYFWRKTNNALSPSYCSWTAIGGFVSNGEDQVFNPNDVLQTAQGFFVEAKATATSVTFNNSQRIGNNAGQFFRMAEPERHRMWLNLTGEGGTFSQTLIGYFQGATLGDDQDIDGKYINDGPVTLTTMIDGEDYAIQGRPLPFEPSDAVPLKMAVTNAGSYTIAIDHLDGIFEGGQNIFLKDKLLGGTHDLKAGPYVFSTEAGTFTDRFEIVYGAALGNGDQTIIDSQVSVYASGGNIVIRTENMAIADVQVYDISGRIVAQRLSIGSNEAVLPISGRVLIVKITTEDRGVVTKKILN